jgi:MFS transporter, PCFT/HCP family, solute carrier family 46 (folate transporter), member 1
MSRIELSQLDTYDEDAPFLDIDERHDEPISAAQPTPPAIPVRPLGWHTRTKGSIVLVIALVKFGIVFLGTMMMMPMFRLIEDIFCHAHYKDDSPDLIDEMKCKVDEVQSSLATIGGILALIGAVISMC